MTHLPECALSDNTDWTSWTVDCCICDRLRACEQRVLDAAREAVRGIASDDLCCMCPTDEGLTLAAIDALREKP